MLVATAITARNSVEWSGQYYYHSFHLHNYIENNAIQCRPFATSDHDWYKIRHAGGQAHYYSCTGTLKQRNLNQWSLTLFWCPSAGIIMSLPSIMADFVPRDSCKRPIGHKEIWNFSLRVDNFTLSWKWEEKFIISEQLCIIFIKQEEVITSFCFKKRA